MPAPSYSHTNQTKKDGGEIAWCAHGKCGLNDYRGVNLDEILGEVIKNARDWREIPGG